jgi:CelD/BcsL family acetyltransferase involved in cellulose biosynthesis
MSPNHVQIEVCTDLQAAQRFQSDWDRLAGEIPMHRWYWMSSWWQEIESRNGTSRLAIVVVKDAGNEVLGIAPFYQKSDWSGRSLRFLGDGKASTDYQRILANNEHSDHVASAVCEWITSVSFEQEFGCLDRILLEGIRGDQPSINRLFHLLETKGWTLHQNPIESSWVLLLNGTFQEILRRGIESQRRKAKKLLQRIDQQAIQLEVVEQVSQLDPFWPEFVALHQMRRRSLGQEGCFACHQFESFLRTATQKLMESRQAKLVFLIKDGYRFAATLVFTSDTQVFMYQTGLDSRFMEFEPGHMMNTALIHWSHQRGAVAFDFLRGDEHYKKRWGCDPIPLFRARLIAPTWSARVKEQFWQTARRCKRKSILVLDWLKRGRSEETIVK